MKYKKHIVFELASFVQRLSHHQKVKVNSFFDSKKYKSSRLLFEKLSDYKNGTFKGQHGLFEVDNKKQFYRFKKRIEEFWQTDQNFQYIEDQHTITKIRLSNKIASAEMMLDLGNPHVSLEVFEDAYIVSKNLEHLDLQLQCARKIFFVKKILGNILPGERWLFIKKSLTKDLIEFQKLTRLFNTIIEQSDCCLQTNGSHYVNKSQLNSIRNFRKLKLEKSQWMLSLIEALYFQSAKEYNKAQTIAKKLLYEYNSNQKLFPKQYFLILIKFILTNLRFLGKFYVIEHISKRISLLKHFPLYQSFPLYKFNFFFLYDSGDIDQLMSNINIVKNDPSLCNYFQIHSHVSAFNLLLQFHMANFSIFLKDLNRNSNLLRSLCFNLRIELRLLEIVCLSETDQYHLSLDKAASLKKWIDRHKNCCKSSHYIKLLVTLKAIIKGENIESLYGSNEFSMYQEKLGIYSFVNQALHRWFVLKFEDSLNQSQVSM